MFSTNSGSKVTTARTTLLDLDDYSLLPIFEYLSIEDLCNMAGLSKRIDQTIQKYYIESKYRFHEQSVEISSNNHKYFMRGRLNGKVIDGFERVTRFLRSFGSSITNLEISCLPDIDQEEFTILAVYIELYCEALIDIKVNAQSNEIINRWHGPFTRVTNLDVMIVEDAYYLSRVFPNIHVLNAVVLNDFLVDDKTSLFFPRLKHLDYYENPTSSRYYNFLKSILRANPQITRFETVMGLDINLISFIAEHLVELEYLKIHVYSNDFTDSSNSNILTFSKVKHFTVDFHRSGMTSCPLWLRFDRLETLTLSKFAISYSVMSFITQNTHLRRIALPMSVITSIELSTIIRGLPYLNTITFRWTEKLKTDDIITAINRSSSLKYVAIYPDSLIDIKPFLEAIQSKWKLTGNIIRLDKQINLKRIE